MTLGARDDVVRLQSAPGGPVQAAAGRREAPDGGTRGKSGDPRDDWGGCATPQASAMPGGGQVSTAQWPGRRPGVAGPPVPLLSSGPGGAGGSTAVQRRFVRRKF
jgi:hypothetical protein